MKEMAFQWMTGGVAALVLSGAARGLPTPLPDGSRFYLWLYNTVHYVLVNWDKPKGWPAPSEPGTNA